MNYGFIQIFPAVDLSRQKPSCKEALLNLPPDFEGFCLFIHTNVQSLKYFSLEKCITLRVSY